MEQAVTALLLLKVHTPAGIKPCLHLTLVYIAILSTHDMSTNHKSRAEVPRYENAKQTAAARKESEDHSAWKECNDR